MALTDYSPKVSEIVEKVKSKLAELLRTDCPLYHVQEKVLEKLIEGTRTRNHLVFQLPTGAGKTRVTAAYLWGLHFLGEVNNGDKILFLTPRRVIRDQVREKEFSLLLRKPFKIESFGEDELAESLSDELHSKLTSRGSCISVMVITPQLLSTHYKKFGKTDYENVKAILLDEGHYMYWGPETSKIISVFLKDEGRIVLAFTATPTNELTDSLGILVYHYHSLKAMERGILANNLKIRVYDTIIDIDTNRDHFNRLAIDDRARKYAEEIMKILEEEVRESGYSLQERIPKTLVVSANVSEAEMIFNKLLEFIEELGEHSKLEKDDFRKTHFIGCAHYKMGPSNEEAKKNIDEFKKSDGGILVTVNMADMGFDDRNLEVLVMARRIRTPVAYVQIRGRVLRKCDTNDPRNIKRQKGYAVLVDLARSAEEHEKRETIEQVEEGGFSSQDVYADLAGILEKEGVREIEANVEVKPLRTFSVRESESENHIFEDEKKKVKQRMQLFNQLIRIKYEFALYKARELIMRELALMREIVMVKQEIEEECGECKKCEKSEKAKELIDKVMKEKVHIDQILDALAKNAMEQGCSAAFLNLNLTLDLKLLQLLEDLYKQLMKKMEPKEAMPARTLPIPSYNNTVRPHAPKGDELYPSLCPKCGSNAKGSTESLTDREWRRLNECPECKTHFIEKYEKRGSQWALVSKEILRNSELL